MLFAVRFEDNPDVGSEVRAKCMPDHLAFLTRNAADIKSAGPLLTPDNQIEGGLWLVEAQNTAQVDDLVKADPFWPTGLRRSVRICAWKQVFADGKVI